MELFGDNMIQSKRMIYSHMVLVKLFEKIDRGFFKQISHEIELFGDSEDGRKQMLFMVNKAKDMVKAKIKKKFHYLEHYYIGEMGSSLLQSYMIAAWALKEGVGSPEEAVFGICNDSKYKNRGIHNWISEGWMFSNEIKPSILLLSLSYLKQLGYEGKVKDRSVQENVKKEYDKFMSLLIDFRPLTDKEFNSHLMGDKERL